ncbi:MAG: hypothetical protein DSY42_02015 [Aquifex sp.]|nr:MAG: hypothetical protein DSY42_02015 [Aquifex sp.]
MKLLTAILITMGFVLPTQYEKDKDELVKIYHQLVKLEQEAKSGKIDTKFVDKLNSLGYPLYMLYQKYRYQKDKSEIHHKLYGIAKKLYEDYLMVKRDIFPRFVKMDAERNNLPVCSVETVGKDKRKLIVRVKNPKDDREIIKIYESTQLYYANRIGFEVIDFRPCRE